MAEAAGRSQQWVSKFESGRVGVSAGDAIDVLVALGADITVRPSEPAGGGG